MIEEVDRNECDEEYFFIYLPHERLNELITWDEFAGNFT